MMNTNHERYQDVYNHLHMKESINLEQLSRKPDRSKPWMLRPAALSASALLILVMAGTGAYAADLGGMKTAIQGWFQGESMKLEAVSTEGGYEFHDPKTGEFLYGGGGVQYDAFGHEIPLDAAEVARQEETVLTEEDGKIFFVSHGDRYEITDLLDQSGRCRFKISAQDGSTLYVDAEVDPDGNSMSLKTGTRPSNWFAQYIQLDPEQPLSD